MLPPLVDHAATEAKIPFEISPGLLTGAEHSQNVFFELSSVLPLRLSHTVFIANGASLIVHHSGVVPISYPYSMASSILNEC